MNFISALIIPLILAAFGLCLAFSKKDLTGKFLEGAKEGLSSGIGLLPTLVLLMTAVAMFSASGAAEWLAGLLQPIMHKLGVPSELTPLLIIRPISGSASTALLSELFEKYGADSVVGRCASVLMASSDTLFYVVAVYMSAAGVKKSRHTLLSAFFVMLLSIFLSCFLVRLFLGA